MPGPQGYASSGWRSLSWRSWGWPALWAAAIALEAMAGGVSVWFAGRHGPALVAVLLNVLAALRFAATLRPGRVPLITKYARCDEQGLPQDCEGYTRALTGCWAGLLAGFSLLHAGAM
ncbi:MAG: hypothetical protein JWR10_4005, partial [Rubritepida sp.]|nr:hypothetical protein [Rubritepida sp.]